MEAREEKKNRNHEKARFRVKREENHQALVWAKFA